VFDRWTTVVYRLTAIYDRWTKTVVYRWTAIYDRWTVDDC
jgi:hypothetical protein